MNAGRPDAAGRFRGAGHAVSMSGPPRLLRAESTDEETRYRLADPDITARTAAEKPRVGMKFGRKGKAICIPDDFQVFIQQGRRLLRNTLCTTRAGAKAALSVWLDVLQE